MWINRGVCGDDHVKLELLYSGICHTDCHIGKNHLGNTRYPCVPGHELIGRVTEVGKNVTKFKVGDNVGVGCMVDTCLECPQCLQGDEQYCHKGKCGTYNGNRKYGRVPGNQDLPTYGGYTASNVVHQHFVFSIPDSIPLELAAPILCAGITMYDPLKQWGATKGHKMVIGIVGIGGLGTMGIKIAKALGHDVVAISTSAAKKEMATAKGATHFVVSTDPESVKAHAGMCNLVLNTISADHDVNTYMPLLAKGGVMCELGLSMKPHTISQLPLIFNRTAITGSNIGGVAATQEVIELCA